FGELRSREGQIGEREQPAQSRLGPEQRQDPAIEAEEAHVVVFRMGAEAVNVAKSRFEATRSANCPGGSTGRAPSRTPGRSSGRGKLPTIPFRVLSWSRVLRKVATRQPLLERPPKRPWAIFRPSCCARSLQSWSCAA